MFLVKLFILLTFYGVHINADCKNGLEIEIGRHCQAYLKCNKGYFQLTKCSIGYVYDSNKKSCILREARNDCTRNELTNPASKYEHKSIPMLFSKSNRKIKKRDLEKGGLASVPRKNLVHVDESIKIVTEDDTYWIGTDGTGESGTEWPFQRETTPSNYWAGTDDAEASGTVWPFQTDNSQGNYWTGTDMTFATGTEWPLQKETNANKHLKKIRGKRSVSFNQQSSTEGDYWTGTDGTGMTGTEWPYQSITTEGNYWTGTDGPSQTGSEWPYQKITTEGDYWTGTDGTGATGTYWPSPHSTSENPASHTINYFTFTEGPHTQWPETTTVSSPGIVTETTTVSSPGIVTETTWTPSDSTFTQATGTEWTVTDDSRTTGTEWTVDLMQTERSIFKMN